jgi:hypothetical protein
MQSANQPGPEVFSPCPAVPDAELPLAAAKLEQHDRTEVSVAEGGSGDDVA